MATKAELKLIADALANLTTQVNAVSANIAAASAAALAAHDAEDDAELAKQLDVINTNSAALAALIPPVQATVAAATPAPAA